MWRRIAYIILSVAFALVFAGCGEEVNAFVAEVKRGKLRALRLAGSTNEYIVAAREYLRSVKDKPIAAEVAAMYARMRNAAALMEFAQEYANGDVGTTLEFSEVAQNEDWPAMSAELVKSILASPDATFGQLRRISQLLQDDDESLAAIAKRMAALAQKRTEREDAELLSCRAAAKTGNPKETIRRLETLSNSAAMPQVRRDAAQLIEKLKLEYRQTKPI